MYVSCILKRKVQLSLLFLLKSVMVNVLAEPYVCVIIILYKDFYLFTSLVHHIFLSLIL